MAPRTPATPAEIANILTEYLASQHVRDGAIAAPRWGFVQYAQKALHTTARNARTWIGDAAAEPDALFRIIGVSHGRISYTLEMNDSSSFHRYKQAHFNAFDNFSFDAAPLIDSDGRVTHGSLTLDEGDIEYLIPVATLDKLVTEAKERNVVLRAKREADELAELAAAEAAHGKGIALLRGLLHRAGINRNRHMEIDHTPEFAKGTVDMSTRVTIRLYGEQLDALAGVLEELGVTPRVRKNRPQPETSPAPAGV